MKNINWFAVCLCTIIILIIPFMISLYKENINLKQQSQHDRAELLTCDAWIEGQFGMYAGQKLWVCQAETEHERPLQNELRDCQEAIWKNDFSGYEPWLEENRKDNERIWGTR